MPDDVGRPELFLSGGETCLQLARFGAVQLKEGLCRAELREVQRARVVGDRDAGDRGGDSDADQSDHQDLLAPLSAEQPPRPAN